MKKIIWAISLVFLLAITAGAGGSSVFAREKEESTTPAAEGLSEQPFIRISDQGNVLTISLDDIEKYHGSVDPCGIFAIKAVQLAASELWDNDIPEREDIRIYTSFPCTTSRDAFEFISRGKNRDEFIFVKPEQLLAISRGLTDSGVRYQFIIVRKSTGDAILIKRRAFEKVAPESFLKAKEKMDGLTPKERKKFKKSEEFKEVKKEFMAALIPLPVEKVFDFKVVRAPSE